MLSSIQPVRQAHFSPNTTPVGTGAQITGPAGVLGAWLGGSASGGHSPPHANSRRSRWGWHGTGLFLLDCKAGGELLPGSETLH